MCSTAVDYPSAGSGLVHRLQSFGAAAEKALHPTVEKIKWFVASPAGQVIIGVGLGVCMSLVYSPLTEKMVQLFGFSAIPPDPFRGLGTVTKVLLSPVICVLGPYSEEVLFRGRLQGGIKDKLESFYQNLGFSDRAAMIAARVTSIFFTSIIFGMVHFTNALFFWCNPVLFLPQVIAATLMGFMLGLAKEFSEELFLPVGMHIGNNTLAMIAMLAEI